jgi:hypothetical protein
LTQSSTEEELDETLEAMTLHGYMEKVTCPLLMMTGEYNLRDPIEEVFELFDEVKSPAELWVFADQFQAVSLSGGPPTRILMIEWIRDRFNDKR